MKGSEMSITTIMKIETDHFFSIAIASLVKGLRDGGEIGEPTINAIEASFRAAADRCAYRGEVPNSQAFQRLADAARDGTPGYHVIP
jgi:hypothetical protein